jgi:hypothetical protein
LDGSLDWLPTCLFFLHFLPFSDQIA